MRTIAHKTNERRYHRFVDKKDMSHKMSGTKVYSAWLNMKTRCYNDTVPQYQYYGAQGVEVCEKWRKSFIEFLLDMGEPSQELSIDRINPYGNYEPDNCRWATRSQQQKNKRKRTTH